MNRTAAYWGDAQRLNAEEWELLCDGCGKCCLHRLQHDETDEVSIRASLVDTRCEVRRLLRLRPPILRVPDCMDVSKNDRSEVNWLPSSCAYRLRAETKPLPNGALIGGVFRQYSKT